MRSPFPLPKTAKRSLTLLVASLLFISILAAQDPKTLKPQGYVNDFASVLSDQAKQQLTALCAEVDQKAGAQIAVVTVQSLDGEQIEQYSIDLATQWGIGPKQKSRGVLILLAPSEHKYRFEVGYGLEEILPDGKVGGFGRDVVPLLKQSDYSNAILQMTRSVASVIAQDKGVTLDSLSGVSIPAPHTSAPPENVIPIVLFIFVFFIFIISFIRRIGRSAAGTSRGHFPWWIIGPMLSGMGGRSGGSSWGGGSFGGGGGGFGGFGGGSFGGGGASGSW
jgi:uncharacterized protein